MYAFRKPFTAASYEGMQLSGFDLKIILVIAQLAGYMLSKFIGIKVVSELKPASRAIAIVTSIVIAELALLGFALVPVTIKPLMLFINGLPLGMVFGFVLSYLEGRKQTEALSAALCASFIISSGVVKSVGVWLVESCGVDEFWMPSVTGLIFFVPLLIAVWLLQLTPPPNDEDREQRSERAPMSADQRWQFLRSYWLGLGLLVMVYVALTVIRTIRDDFAVELWRDMDVAEKPSIFARSETIVALAVTSLNAAAIWVKHNLSAIRLTLGLMSVSFGLIALSAYLQSTGAVSPFVFMVMCGIGMYVPYVAFHTTVFERLIAISRHPGNLGFLMYLADAIGYLGYAVVLATRNSLETPGSVLPFFRTLLGVISLGSIVALMVALMYFHHTWKKDHDGEADENSAGPETVT